MNSEHWRSMREIFGDPDLGLPPSENPEADQAYARGVGLMEEGDAAGARQAFIRADELGHAGAPRELAQWASFQGDMDAWGELLGRARERGDGNAAAWFGTARRGEPNRGIESLRFADEAGDPEGARALGLALKEEGDLAGAEAAFRRSEDRGSASGSLALGNFLREERGDLLSAEAAFLRAEQRGHPKGAFNLIEIYSDRGDVAAADRARARTIELAARHSTAFKEMQGPDFAEFVQTLGRPKAAATTAGSGCAIVVASALLAGGATIALLMS